MEGIQYFNYGLMAALMLMSIIFVILPIPPINDLDKFKVTTKLLSLSYMSLGLYCLSRTPNSIDLFGAPFLFISIFQTHLLAISFINMMNADYVKRSYLITMLGPSVILFVLFLVCALTCGYHRVGSYADLCQSLFEDLHPDVLVRVCTSVYYLCLAVYYMFMYASERKAVQERLENMTIDVELHDASLKRLYIGNRVGHCIAAITFVVLFTTSIDIRSNCTTFILALYVVIGFIVLTYPKIYLSVSDAMKVEEDDASERTYEEKMQAWKEMRERIVREGLYKQQGVTVSRLAECFDVSRGAFSSAVNTCEGVNFNTFIKNLRIEAAQQLMTEHQGSTMVEVMTAVGYTDIANFSRHFKQVVGIPPAEWRRHNCAQPHDENSEK